MVQEIIEKSLLETIKKNEQGAVIMMELPKDTYFESNTDSIKLLTDQGFQGIYISFNRPFENIVLFFKQREIDIDKLFFIAVAQGSTYDKQLQNKNCIHISPTIEIDELVRAIYTLIQD